MNIYCLYQLKAFEDFEVTGSNGGRFVLWLFIRG